MANNEIIFEKLFANKFFILIEPDFRKNPKNNIWRRLGQDRRVGLMKDHIYNIEKTQKWQTIK